MLSVEPQQRDTRRTYRPVALRVPLLLALFAFTIALIGVLQYTAQTVQWSIKDNKGRPPRTSHAPRSSQESSIRDSVLIPRLDATLTAGSPATMVPSSSASTRRSALRAMDSTSSKVKCTWYTLSTYTYPKTTSTIWATSATSGYIPLTTTFTTTYDSF